ncbi:X-box-binding protein 1 [Frankliniella fusca]|uniref:X-box-binding protein 1 n=1 Tax=Frankliniella fusca TaxID=407009 RepID=A0AAE1GXN1_9NEOP|nr:X-box-binding protein 1 [Frankliniella fusca]
MVAPQAIIITVPAAAGGGSALDMNMNAQTMETTSIPSRKRRLAHLSLEEKMYRKKLKNRVAAQTSRDRKKARMDELESSVASMAEELEEMRRLKERMEAENVLLKQQLQDAQATNAALLETLLEKEKCACSKNEKSINQIAPVSFPSILSRPAESIRHPLLKGPEGKRADNLKSLTILLMAYLLSPNSSPISDLTKICQTLETWSDSLKASYKRPLPMNRCDTSRAEQVVGKAPEILESRRSSCCIGKGPEIEVFSAEAPSGSIARPTRRRLPSGQPKQYFKKVLPREEPKSITQQNLSFVTGSPTCVTLPRMSAPTDILASALSDALAPEDCITIIVPTPDESDCIILEDAVQEVTTSYLMPSFKDEPLSPKSDITDAVKSDCGYESFGSPHSDISSSEAMSDLWNDSFTQLFPNTLI